MNMNTSYAPLTENYKPNLTLIKNDDIVRPYKYNKDGTVCKRKSLKQKGKSSEVYQFKTKEEINAVLDLLNKRIETAPDNDKRRIAYRNKLLFIIGINIGLRASDLVRLQWNFFFDNNNNFREYYSLQPKKQRKYNKFVKLFFNDAVKNIIKEYLSEYPYENREEYLFFSRKGETIKEASLCNLIKSIAEDAGITCNIGSHSLRKTFGYWVWHTAEDKTKALVILQRIFNHSDSATTAKYIGITDCELQDTFVSINLGYM